jgi:hypothetical protein
MANKEKSTKEDDVDKTIMLPLVLGCCCFLAMVCGEKNLRANWSNLATTEPGRPLVDQLSVIRAPANRCESAHHIK